MTKLQRVILLSAAVLIILVLVFPVYGVPSGPGSQASIWMGRVFTWPGNHDHALVLLNTFHTLLEVVGIALAAGLAYFAVRPNDPR